MKTLSKPGTLALTALAPAIWGSTYIATTELLPAGYPLHVAMLRALPAGLLLLLVFRALPRGRWWWRVTILGTLNFTFFWAMLFVSAYRLPGGVAATVGAVQPLIVIGLARLVMRRKITTAAVLAALSGLAGVALLVLTPHAALDPIGIAAGLAGALSMAAGTVLTRHWQPDVPALTFTAWQLTAGGLLLVPLALLLEPPLPPLSGLNLLGFLCARADRRRAHLCPLVSRGGAARNPPPSLPSASSARSLPRCSAGRCSARA